jgi:phosphatidylglycerol:prolipoprotein diacylglycerol transferase
VWQGGLEVLGGAILAIAVIFLYLRWHKLPVRRYLDIVAVGLMLALVFGRIGCFLKGDCFGKPTNLPWAVRFPYASDPYYSQVLPDQKRNRSAPHLERPEEYFDVYNDKKYLKPFENLTEDQKQAVTTGPYRCLPVHPTQLYSSANALLGCFLLYLFWRRSQDQAKAEKNGRLFAKPGSTFALMFIFYGITRFLIEFLRDDNPFEYGSLMIYKGGTISQNLSLYLIVFGILLMVLFQKMKPDKTALKTEK